MTLDRQRQDYFEALHWASHLMTNLPSDSLELPTPCAGFDVRSLLGHLIGTAQRGLATAQRVPTRGIPHVVDGIPDADLGPVYAELATRIERAWVPLVVTDEVVAPWGACTALEAARGFTVETVAHGWDLAVATGQPSEAPNGIADRCLTVVAEVVPDRLRGIMYDAPILGMETTSATERLAHLLGHQTSGRAQLPPDGLTSPVS